MENPDDYISFQTAAEEAIDEDALAEILERATDGEYDKDAVKALRAVAADEIVADALAAAKHARRRGRALSPEDVGDVADKRRECCTRGPPMEPTSLKFEW
jgi:histone H3/H4